MSMNGYAKQQTIALETASPEKTLAWGLTTTARKLAVAKDQLDNNSALMDAVRLNWRLWTIIQTEQANPDCTSPKHLREGLLNLSNYVDKRSMEILSAPDPEKLDILISINRNIAAGLLGTDVAQDQHMAPVTSAVHGVSAAG